MTDERGGRYFREARFFLAGDKVAAQSHILEARSLMGYMRDMHSLGGPPIQVQYATLQDGTRIKAVMMNGQYQAEIISPRYVDESKLEYTRSLWFTYPLTSLGTHAFLPQPAEGALPTSLSAAGAFGGGFVTARASSGVAYLGYTEDGGLAGYPNTKQTLTSAGDADSAVLIGGKFLFYHGAVFNLGSSYLYGLGIAAGNIVLAGEGVWPSAPMFLVPAGALDAMARARTYKLTTPFVGGDPQNGTMDTKLATDALPLNIWDYSASIVDGTGSVFILPRTGHAIDGTNKLMVAGSYNSGGQFVVLEVGSAVRQLQAFPYESGLVDEQTVNIPLGSRNYGTDQDCVSAGGSGTPTTSTLTTTTFDNSTYGGAPGTPHVDTAMETSPLLPDGEPITVTRTYTLAHSGSKSVGSTSTKTATTYNHPDTHALWVTHSSTSNTTSSTEGKATTFDATTEVDVGGKFSYTRSVEHLESTYSQIIDTSESNSWDGDVQLVYLGAPENTSGGGTTTTSHVSMFSRSTALIVADVQREVYATMTMYNGQTGPPSTDPDFSPQMTDLHTVRAELRVVLRGVETTLDVYSADGGSDVYTHDSTKYTPFVSSLDYFTGCIDDGDGFHTNHTTAIAPFGTTYSIPTLRARTMPAAGRKWVGGNGYTMVDGALVLGLSATLLSLGAIGTGTVRIDLCKVFKIVDGSDGEPVLDVQDAATALGLDGLADDMRFTEAIFA